MDILLNRSAFIHCCNNKWNIKFNLKIGFQREMKCSYIFVSAFIALLDLLMPLKIIYYFIISIVIEQNYLYYLWRRQAHRVSLVCIISEQIKLEWFAVAGSQLQMNRHNSAKVSGRDRWHVSIFKPEYEPVWKSKSRNKKPSKVIAVDFSSSVLVCWVLFVCWLRNFLDCSPYVWPALFQTSPCLFTLRRVQWSPKFEGIHDVFTVLPKTPWALWPCVPPQSAVLHCERVPKGDEEQICPLRPRICSLRQGLLSLSPLVCSRLQPWLLSSL